jgi:hypothetical protein
MEAGGRGIYFGEKLKCSSFAIRRSLFAKTVLFGEQRINGFDLRTAKSERRAANDEER